MKNKLFLGAFLLVLGSGYFLFFFETEAEEEQARIEELGKWSLKNRAVTSNRELARELGMEMVEFTKKFGDLSSQTKDLHYKTGLFLSTVYPDNEDNYVMTVSYGLVKEMSSAYIFIPATFDYSIFRNKVVFETDEPNEIAEKLLGNLTFITSNKCLGKVCFITLKPAHIKLLSISDSFKVKVSGWYYGSQSGNRISTDTEYEIPTSGLISHLSEKMQFDAQKVDEVQVAKKYLCQNDKSFCDKSYSRSELNP